MSQETVSEPLKDPELRKALIDYHKWIVTLAVFGLGACGSLVLYFGIEIRWPWLFVLVGADFFYCVYHNVRAVGELIRLHALLQDQQPKLPQAAVTERRYVVAFQSQSRFLGYGVVALAVAFIVNWDKKVNEKPYLEQPYAWCAVVATFVALVLIGKRSYQKQKKAEKT